MSELVTEDERRYLRTMAEDEPHSAPKHMLRLLDTCDSLDDDLLTAHLLLEEVLGYLPKDGAISKEIVRVLKKHYPHFEIVR